MSNWTKEELVELYPHGSITKNVDEETIVLELAEWDEWIDSQVGEPKPVSGDNLLSDMARQQRNMLLAESDWTQILDCPLPPENVSLWATYRQQLRDLPADPDWPNVEFPTPPEN